MRSCSSTRPQAKLERVPMLRGRIIAANGVQGRRAQGAADAAWVLQSDRGITYATDVPRGSRVVEGEWWRAGCQRAAAGLVRERSIADGLGLKIGDTVTVNVLGRNITARVANLRSVDWESLGINFVMVFSPERVSRRAAYPYRNTDIPKWRDVPRRRSRCSRRWLTRFRRSRPSG